MMICVKISAIGAYVVYVLGPVLFYALFTTPLSTIISSFGMNQYLYADGTQIYISLRPICFQR